MPNISRDKRNLGALKLVNFLQPDNFDADLAIARLATKKKSESGSLIASELKLARTTKPEVRSQSNSGPFVEAYEKKRQTPKEHPHRSNPR